jgi:hypothetical protein
MMAAPSAAIVDGTAEVPKVLSDVTTSAFRFSEPSGIRCALSALHTDNVSSEPAFLSLTTTAVGEPSHPASAEAASIGSVKENVTLSPCSGLPGVAPAFAVWTSAPAGGVLSTTTPKVCVSPAVGLTEYEYTPAAIEVPARSSPLR